MRVWLRVEGEERVEHHFRDIRPLIRTVRDKPQGPQSKGPCNRRDNVSREHCASEKRLLYASKRPNLI